MTDETRFYRWNTSAAAEAYDRTAPAIHPFYETVQDRVLEQLSFSADEPFVIVDLGGGSGRLLERVLGRFAAAHAVLVDQSEPFLALAERRLRQFGPRVSFVQSRLQDWPARGRVSPRRKDRVSERLVHVIVSTSAIHHLEPAEKQTLFAKCYAALAPHGVFINGDEYRPADDEKFRALLEEWSAHMLSAIESGGIDDSFRATFEQWHDRNIKRFGAPKKSGDDCLETAATQLEQLKLAGFTACELVWSEKLWGVVKGRK